MSVAKRKHAEYMRKYRLTPAYRSKASKKKRAAYQKAYRETHKTKQAAHRKVYYETHKASLSVAAKEKRAEAKRAEVHVTHRIAQSGDGDTFYCTVCAARGSNGRKLRKLAEACSGQAARGSISSLNLLQAGVKPEGMRK